MSAPRAILHVDMDAFYASVEQRDRPELRGQPVIVGGTSNRGVVAAASYEVRTFGVRSAMPIREALRRCPHAICVKPRMSVYREVSHQVFAIFHEYTPVVEGLSLDEAFLDVTASLALKGDAVSIARGIKDRIRAQTQLGASVGVAPNKLVAKIASDLEQARRAHGGHGRQPARGARSVVGAPPARGSAASSANASRPPASRRSASCARRPTPCCGPSSAAIRSACANAPRASTSGR